jgi:hypothetical protein
MMINNNMGVHDYRCFIQRNDQCLEQYSLCDEEEEEEEDDFNCYNNNYGTGAGNNKCVIVLVPKHVNISATPLSDFSKFQTFHWNYSWDDWDFSGEGYGNSEYYRETLLGNNIPYGDCSVWSHLDYPDSKLVNFDPVAYSAFVEKTITPQQLCYEYYYTCFSNRRNVLVDGRLSTLDKQELYDILANWHLKPV